MRYAAGLYWLLDMEQSGVFYIDPIPLNEEAAEIWKRFARGMSIAEVSEWLSERYEIPLEQAQSDVNDFIEQLQSKKVAFGGKE